ncbi:InlB B-repeat-containing protein [Adhaeribacter radiodurans]|uniref:Glycoside hydrolase family 88 protein n=1 Tax=Adhaeribacter radiodurans TaxID=2745197 RepID=A0A7L7L5C1_9BACT|nr:glycoside hydrolase family 88 protein [Adhaeribacter radiodurans]QMU28002.1 glycoside hydrolase family 88 protein [Adhaeribacter radiodurans]
MKYKIILLQVLLLSLCCLPVWAQVDADSAFRHATTQTKVMLQEITKAQTPQHPELVSPRTLNSEKELKLISSRDWTSGFFPGNLWFLYEYTQDSYWLNQAKAFTSQLASEQFNTETHDVGFKVYCSYGAGYRLTQDTAYRSVIIQAAKSLATRFSPKVGCIQSWKATRKWPFPVIIDNMMNLELLFAATRLTGDSTYYNIAKSHADTTLKNHFRADYSSWHVVDYDPVTGKVRQKNTHQGANDSSAWARGQAWGLYGYTMCYRETKNRAYLTHAENIASFILNHPNLPADLVPYWDFNAPLIPNEPRDASAAAVMASALYELSTYSKNNKKYRAAADKIVNSLANLYASPKGENRGFILLHSTGHKPGNSEIDVPLIYADYYYLEALLRQKEINVAPKLSVVNNKSVIVGRKLRFTVSANDANPKQIQNYSLINAPAGAYIQPATGVFNWTPSKEGTYTFFVKASDNGTPVLTDQVPVVVKVTPVPYYNLQIAVTGSGSVTREPMQDSYAHGTKVTLNAVPAPGYKFVGWSGDALGKNTLLSLTMTNRKQVVANFVLQPNQDVAKLNLINTNTKEVITTLTEGIILNLAALPSSNLNVEAVLNPTTVKSVTFELSGEQNRSQTESKAPYFLFGDVDGNPIAWVPAKGKYTLKVTPYSEANGEGNAREPLTIYFTVIDKPLSESERVAYLAEQSNKNIINLFAYPTPTSDGHFKVFLPAPLRGNFTYTLISAVGSTLTSGEKNAAHSAIATFDFSRHMSSAGIYYLRLENATTTSYIKLIRH